MTMISDENQPASPNRKKLSAGKFASLNQQWQHADPAAVAAVASIDIDELRMACELLFTSRYQHILFNAVFRESCIPKGKQPGNLYGVVPIEFDIFKLRRQVRVNLNGLSTAETDLWHQNVFWRWARGRGLWTVINLRYQEWWTLPPGEVRCSRLCYVERAFGLDPFDGRGEDTPYIPRYPE